MPERIRRSAKITSVKDPVRLGLWLAGAALTAVAAGLRPAAVLPTAAATIGSFATLAAIIGGSVLAERAGVFRLLARVLVPDRPPRPVAAAAVLTFTALLSALANLDVAVVVATPLVLQTARRHRLPAGRLAVAVAITANATSFLLPTSNITSLLLLGRRPISAAGYLSQSWLPWLLVTALTIGALGAWLTRAGPSRPAAGAQAGLSARGVIDLVPMFLAASAIRAILAGGIALHGGLIRQLTTGTALACAVSNLPAAAAIRPSGTAGLWAAILATTIGPNLLITGSVATLICRRIARDSGVALRAGQFTAVGAALLPAQLALAFIGLHLIGALPA
jgi:Na+/H+ antiporter NhaD/arsenite permease-like protein